MHPRVQLRLHPRRDQVVHSRHFHQHSHVQWRFLLRVCGPNERRCGRLHQLSGERVDVSTNVQLWVYGVWNVFVQRRDCDRGDVLRESLRCVCGSYERRRGRLHEHSGERVDMPAHVQLGVHGIWDIILQCRYSNRRDVLRESM
jgi:hypothetical protein